MPLCLLFFHLRKSNKKSMSIKTNYLSKGPRLLVPVLVKAMMVDKRLGGHELNKWARNQAEYKNITKNLTGAFPRSFATSESKHSNRNNVPPNPGVHLQWVLPKGLVHGQHNEANASIDFLQSPNRWLVVRFWEKDSKLESTGWVIASNYMNINDGTCPYLINSPQDSSSNIKSPTINYIGKNFPWDKPNEWTNIKKSNQINLRGATPYNVAFNNYTVDNQNVFSFVDSATAEDLNFSNDAELESQGVILSYLVLGWYQNPTEKDPLFKKETIYQDPIYNPQFNKNTFLATLATLGFDIGGQQGLTEALNAFKKKYQDGTITSPLMLCHGGIHSINWLGPNYSGSKTNSKTGKPQKNNPNKTPGITIGNSPFDALAAFLRETLSTRKVLKPKEIESSIEFMYALYKNELDSFTSNNGKGLLSKKVNDSWYESHTQGSFWEISLSPETKESKKTKGILAKGLIELEKLNTQQKNLNQENAQLAGLIKQYYLAIYGYCQENNLRNNAQANLWSKKGRALLTSIETLQSRINHNKGNVGKDKLQLEKILGIKSGTPNNTFQLKEVSNPKFWMPKDPVVCVFTPPTHGKYEKSGKLPCRMSGQTVSNLKINNTTQHIAPNYSLPTGLNGVLPKETLDLIIEFLLLDPNKAALLNSAKSATIKKQQTMIWNSELYEGFNISELMKYAGLNGVRPAFRAFQTYTPPWSPLYIDWAGFIAPNSSEGNAWKIAPNTLTSHPEIPIKNWTLDEGTESEKWALWNDYYDYQWKSPQQNAKKYIPDVLSQTSGGSQVYIDENLITISGRSLIGSHLPKILRTRLRHLNLKKFDSKKRAKIEIVAEILKDFDINIQRLSGFNEYLTKFDVSNQMPASMLAGYFQQNYKGTDFTAPEFHKTYELFAKTNFGIPFDSVSEETKYNYFYAIRSGYFRLSALRIVDNFGISYYPLGTAFTINPNFGVPINKGIGLNNKEAKPGAWIQLPPRITQPSRMLLEWIDGQSTIKPPPPVSQGNQNNPICGWLVPNHLDRSLMIFDTDGNYQVSLIVYKNKSNEFEIAEEINPLENKKINNPFLNGLVNQLLQLPSNDLEGFMNQIDVAMWYTAPKVAQNKQGLTPLLGRPLALVRAKVSFELAGIPNQDFNLNDPDGLNNPAYKYTPFSPGNPSTIPNPYGLNSIPFEFYLGTPELPNNGLIGYFEDTNFDTFFVPQLHTEGASNSFVKKRPVHTTSLNNAGMSDQKKCYQYFTMLVDYRGAFHLVSGLNPVFDIQLAPRFYEQSLAKMNAVFRIGPILTDPHQLRMPKPSNTNQKLAWIYESSIKIWKDDEQLKEKNAYENPSIDSATSTPIFSTKRNTINEGWLELNDAFSKKITE